MRFLTATEEDLKDLETPYLQRNVSVSVDNTTTANDGIFNI